MEKKTAKQTNVIEHIDYKNVEKLRAWQNPHARMFNRNRTGLSAHGQRSFALAVKRARYMALVPYVSR